MINEVLTNPNSIWNCADLSGNALPSSEIWIELYNPQSQPFNLFESQALLRLSNGVGKFDYSFFTGTTIAAHGFLVLFPAKSGALFTQGLIEFLISGTLIDYVIVQPLPPDYSYARIPDGGNNWQQVATPTIDASNTSNVLASPTPSPTPTHVTTKRSRKRSPGISSGRVSRNDSGGIGGTDGTVPPSDGTQPGWSNLQLPAAASTTATSPAPGSILSQQSTLSQPASGNGGVDPPHIILITLLGALLAGVALWGWWHFKSRKLT